MLWAGSRQGSRQGKALSGVPTEGVVISPTIPGGRVSSIVGWLLATTLITLPTLSYTSYSFFGWLQSITQTIIFLLFHRNTCKLSITCDIYLPLRMTQMITESPSFTVIIVKRELSDARDINTGGEGVIPGRRGGCQTCQKNTQITSWLRQVSHAS